MVISLTPNGVQVVATGVIGVIPWLRDPIPVLHCFDNGLGWLDHRCAFESQASARSIRGWAVHENSWGV